MTPDAALIRKLSAAIEHECALYKKYIALVEEEQSCVSTYQSEKVEDIAGERALLCDKMQEARYNREELQAALGQADEPLKLSEAVARFCKPEDARKLAPQIDTLRAMMKRSQRASQEFSQTVNFSLGLVSSTISIIWSATQGVQRAYNGRGMIRESFHPSMSRMSGVLTEA